MPLFLSSDNTVSIVKAIFFTTYVSDAVLYCFGVDELVISAKDKSSTYTMVYIAGFIHLASKNPVNLVPY